MKQDADFIAKATLHHVDHQGMKVVVYEWAPSAPAENMQTILMVHGWGSNGTRFKEIIQAVLKRGHRAVAFDAPAHGLSEGELSSGFMISEVLEQVAGKFAPIDAVAAHSIGTFSTLLAFHRGFTAKKVIMISGPAAADSILIPFVELLGIPNRITERMITMFEEWVDASLDLLNVLELIPGADIQALIVHDECDKMVPYDNAVALASAWDGAQLHTTNGLGHSRILTSPDVAQVAAAFLFGK